MNTIVNSPKKELTEKAWEDFIRAINPSDISIQVENGIVTLQGTVDSYSRKLLAEQIVSNVTGVKSIINELQVRISANVKKKDTELLDLLLDALNKDFDLSQEDSAEKARPRAKTNHHPAVVTTNEFSYWEIFC
ncbi:MAG: BON domain-containing protein [Bacteroidia bacterium]|nr:BON domain-containing protein [Bacteroidia bacterium]